MIDSIGLLTMESYFPLVYSTRRASICLFLIVLGHGTWDAFKKHPACEPHHVYKAVHGSRWF